MRLEILGEYIAFSKRLSFTAASKVLHLSQSTVSAHMAELEREVGVQLISRKRPVELTPAGKRFLSGAEEIVEAYERAVSDCAKLASQEARILRVVEPPMLSCFPDATRALIFNALRDVESSSPLDRVEVLVAAASSKETEMVLEGDADCCFCTVHSDFVEGGVYDGGDLEGREVLPEGPLFVRVSRGHPLAGRKSVSVSDLAEYPLMLPSSPWMSASREAIEHEFSRCGIQPIIRLKSANSLMGYFVSVGEDDLDVIICQDYVARNPMTATNDAVCCIPVEGTEKSLRLCILYRKDSANPLLSKMILLTEQAKATFARSDFAKRRFA